MRTLFLKIFKDSIIKSNKNSNKISNIVDKKFIRFADCNPVSIVKIKDDNISKRQNFYNKACHISNNKLFLNIQNKKISNSSKNEPLDIQYTSILKKLFDINKFSSTKVNLDNITKACEVLGNPHKNINYIHVTGTNGKGSVCKKLASVFENAGFKTGLFISPHITTFRERIQINSKFIPKEKIVEILSFLFEITIKKNIILTYFEYVTLLCFLYFNENNIDIAIMEVGLGGNLDSTNVINPLLSVITSIGIDHTDSLGFTQEEIAERKAGIIKPNVPCIIGPDSFPRKVFIENAIRNNSKIYILDNCDIDNSKKEFLGKILNSNSDKNLINIISYSNSESNKFKIVSEFKNNIFDFELENSIIARHVIEIFNENYPNFYQDSSKSNSLDSENNEVISKNNLKNEENIIKGINTRQPCRKEDVFQIQGREKVEKKINENIEKLFLNKYSIQNNKHENFDLMNIQNLKFKLKVDFSQKYKKTRIKNIFLDVGHNSHGLEKLLYSIRINNPNTFIRVVAGFSTGKDQKEIIKIICYYADKIYLGSADHQRAIPYNILLERVKDLINDYNIDDKIFSYFDDEKEFYFKLFTIKNKLEKNEKDDSFPVQNMNDELNQLIEGRFFIILI